MCLLRSGFGTLQDATTSKSSRRHAHNHQGQAVEDRNNESEPCRDAHVVAGAAREAGKCGRDVGHPGAQDGQAAAGGVGVESHEEQQDYQEEDIAEDTERAGEHRTHQRDELSGVDRVHDGVDLLLLDAEAPQRVPCIRHHLRELVAVLGEQLGQLRDGDDQGEAEQEQHQVGGKRVRCTWDRRIGSQASNAPLSSRVESKLRPAITWFRTMLTCRSTRPFPVGR
jgi:hypothetical protein